MIAKKRAKLSKADMEDMLHRFVSLEDAGQVSLECEDARDLLSKVKRGLNIPEVSNFVNVRLCIDISDVVLPDGLDIANANNYDLTISFPAGMDSGDYTVDVVDWEED